MKKIISALLFVIALFNVNAQELNSNQESGSERKNDVTLDPFLLIAVPMLNVSYERLIDKKMGVGVNAMVVLDDSETDYFTQFSPYFRYYMGKKYASGFFFEGFIPVTMQKEWGYVVYDDINNMYYSSYEGEKNFTTVGVGFGVGGKWVIKNRLVIEASGGIARRFGNFDRNDFSPVTGKIMGGIGYRF